MESILWTYKLQEDSVEHETGVTSVLKGLSLCFHPVPPVHLLIEKSEDRSVLPLREALVGLFPGKSGAMYAVIITPENNTDR